MSRRGESWPSDRRTVDIGASRRPSPKARPGAEGGDSLPTARAESAQVLVGRRPVERALQSARLRSKRRRKALNPQKRGRRATTASVPNGWFKRNGFESSARQRAESASTKTGSARASSGTRAKRATQLVVSESLAGARHHVPVRSAWHPPRSSLVEHVRAVVPSAAFETVNDTVGSRLDMTPIS